jgi:hypothetical protein
MNALALQVLDECGVFNAAHTVTDTCGLESAQGFPNAVCAGGFSGVGGAMEAVIDCIAKGWDVRVDGETGLVSGDVEGRDTGALKLVDEVRG